MSGEQVEEIPRGDWQLVWSDDFEGPAGQLPDGFAPGTLYQSRTHPRNLQMTVFGASDALHSIGIDWRIFRIS